MDGPSFDEVLPTSVQLLHDVLRPDTREAVTSIQSLSIMLGYLAAGNVFEDLKQRKAVSLSPLELLWGRRAVVAR